MIIMKQTVLTKSFSLLLTAFLLGVVSCSKEKDIVEEAGLPGADMPTKVVVGTETSTLSYQTLFAGQTIDAGSVSYDDIDTNSDGKVDALQIMYSTKDGWELTQVHFFVDYEFAKLPTNKSGNPQPGQFPYKSGDITGQKSYTITIPFTTLGFDCANATRGLFVAAHAGLRKPLSGGTYQNESGWGDGLRLVQRGNWAMYNTVFITCDQAPPPVAEATTETAFAYDGDPNGCFRNFADYLDNENRWGWTNGPLKPGTYNFPIYAGAGQCDITKGANVGTLAVNYNGTSATFTYTLKGVNAATGLPYTLREVHLYAGTEAFPRNKQGELTIAPGQYPHKASGLSGQSHTITVSGLSNTDINVIAHAVVHGFPKL